MENNSSVDSFLDKKSLILVISPEEQSKFSNENFSEADVKHTGAHLSYVKRSGLEYPGLRNSPTGLSNRRNSDIELSDFRNANLEISRSRDDFKVLMTDIKRYGISVVETPPKDQAYLQWQSGELRLCTSSQMALGINFTERKYHRQFNPSSDLLCRACGWHLGLGSVWDLTAGLGVDSVVLAQAGFAVTAFERHPYLALLLRHALRTLQSNELVNPTIDNSTTKNPPQDKQDVLKSCDAFNTTVTVKELDHLLSLDTKEKQGLLEKPNQPNINKKEKNKNSRKNFRERLYFEWGDSIKVLESVLVSSFHTLNSSLNFSLNQMGDTLGVFNSELTNIEIPEVIYYDPMYPSKNKTALPSKEMQVLRELNGPNKEEESVELIEKALSLKGVKRVVVKRPLRAPPLNLRSTSKAPISLSGKLLRFDIYPSPK